MNLVSPTGSIRRRLIVQLALVAALLSLLFFFAVRVVAERAASDTQDNILAASATSIADAVYLEQDNVQLELPYPSLSMLGTISDDRVFYRVLSDGETLTGYGDLPVVQKQAKSSGPIFTTTSYRGDTVRIATVSRSMSSGTNTRQVEVIVAQTRDGLATISSQITTMATAIGMVFFLLATALSALAAKFALSPIDMLAASVRRRGPQDLRPVTAETPSELQPLVSSLNKLMERLDGALHRSEDLITEAAHRIRTPLATVRTQAEVIHRTMRKEENRNSVREMIRAVDESSRTAGQLLDHAMVSLRSEQLIPQEVNLGSLLKDTISRLEPTAELKDIQINLSLPANELKIKGDPILLQSAIRNVLDNAIKYSPDETEINVSAGDMNPCRISVRDQGRGFAGAGKEKLTRRFSRGENVGDVVGSGLGLTIAEEVAQAHGGKLKIANNENGAGACVSFILPLS